MCLLIQLSFHLQSPRSINWLRQIYQNNALVSFSCNFWNKRDGNWSSKHRFKKNHGFDSVNFIHGLNVFVASVLPLPFQFQIAACFINSQFLLINCVISNRQLFFPRNNKKLYSNALKFQIIWYLWHRYVLYWRTLNCMQLKSKLGFIDIWRFYSEMFSLSIDIAGIRITGILSIGRNKPRISKCMHYKNYQIFLFLKMALKRSNIPNGQEWVRA